MSKFKLNNEYYLEVSKNAVDLKMLFDGSAFVVISTDAITEYFDYNFLYHLKKNPYFPLKKPALFFRKVILELSAMVRTTIDLNLIEVIAENPAAFTNWYHFLLRQFGYSIVNLETNLLSYLNYIPQEADEQDKEIGHWIEDNIFSVVCDDYIISSEMSFSKIQMISEITAQMLWVKFKEDPLSFNLQRRLELLTNQFKTIESLASTYIEDNLAERFGEGTLSAFNELTEILNDREEFSLDDVMRQLNDLDLVTTLEEDGQFILSIAIDVFFHLFTPNGIRNVFQAFDKIRVINRDSTLTHLTKADTKLANYILSWDAFMLLIAHYNSNATLLLGVETPSGSVVLKIN